MKCIIKRKNSLKRAPIFLNILIIFSFLFLSFLSILYIKYNNKIFFTGDAPFHIERISELIKSPVLFPRFSLNSFDSAGSAVMSMYPYLFLYPTVILFYILGSIKLSLYITFVLGTFLTLIISYYSSIRFSKNYIFSYLFSLTYSLSYEFIGMYFSGNDMGVYWSSVILPLVIFGFIYYLQNNKWIMLSIGMTLVMYNSIITFTFLIVLLIIWFLFNLNIVNRDKIQSLIKAIILSICSTALVWIPIVKLMMFNKLNTPSSKSIESINIFDLIRYAIFPKPRMPIQLLTIYSLFGIILGIMLFKYLPRFIKQIYIISIIIVLFCSNIFPWKVFTSNFVLFKLLRKLQFSFRLLVVPQLLLNLILTYCISYLLIKVNKQGIKRLLFLFIILFIIVIQFLGQDVALSTEGNGKQINNSSIYKDYSEGLNYNDYFPQVTSNKMSLLYNHEGEFNTNEKIKFIPKMNGKFTFYTRHHLNHIVIPFVYYNGINYKCYLDDKVKDINNNRNQLMSFDNINKGHHKINIYINPDISYNMSFIITLIGMFGYLVAIYRRRQVNRIK